MRGYVDQRLGPYDRRPGPALLDRLRRGNRSRNQLVLEPAALLRADPRQIAVVDRPGEEVNLIQRADQRRSVADRLPEFERSEREVGEAPGEIRRRLVEAI